MRLETWQALELGGPQGAPFDVRAGDVLVLPAPDEDPVGGEGVAGWR